jgi:hypothetical protein
VSTEVPAWVDRVLSAPRWQRYLAAANGRPETAWLLYQWNLEVSSSFYEPLHWLELSFRNAVHQTLRDCHNREDWWITVPLDATAYHKIAKASEHARKRRGADATPDDLVAELTLGFWVSLFAAKYTRTLWVPSLHRVFRPAYRGERRSLHMDLIATLFLRNRVMHHEPIHNLHLEADVARIERLLEYVTTGASIHALCLKRVRDVIAVRPVNHPASGGERG